MYLYIYYGAAVHGEMHSIINRCPSISWLWFFGLVVRVFVISAVPLHLFLRWMARVNFRLCVNTNCKWVEINKCMHALKRMTIPIFNVFYGLLWFSFLAFQLVFLLFFQLLDLFLLMKHFQRTNANRSRDRRMIDKQFFFSLNSTNYGKK